MILRGTASAGLLAVLHAQCFAPGERWDEAAFGSVLAMPGGFGGVAGTDAGRPDALALARVAADEAELLTVGVLPAARGRGLAARLLEELAAEAAGLGAARLFLEVSVGNAPALALYRRLGFGEVGRRRQYYPDGSSALVLMRPLRHPALLSGA